MPVSNLLEFLQLTEAQSQKAAAFNEVIAEMEKTIAEKYTVVGSDGDEGDDIVLPYDDTDDLSDRSALRFIYLEIDNSSTRTIEVVHPAVQHIFYVRNTSNYTATIKTPVGDGADVAAGAGQIVYCDGTDCVGLLTNFAAITQVDSYNVNYFGTPTASEVIASFLPVVDVTFPADFFDSRGEVQDNPDGTYEMGVFAEATQIGTISVAVGGAVTFATTSNEEQTCTDIQTLQVRAPATVDPGISGIQLALKGFIQVNQ